MSQAFDQIVQELNQITPQEKFALRELLDKELSIQSKNGTAAGDVSAFGWAKGRIKISADFDAPLEDFKEYME